MKSVICQLVWKLGTTMCFCHSILIFKIISIFRIILVFKIMIVIRFQIWLLIKFKLQRREWVWLKLCFSHAMRLLYYKYISQGMHKREGTITKKPWEEVIRKNREKRRQGLRERRGRERPRRAKQKPKKFNYIGTVKKKKTKQASFWFKESSKEYKRRKRCPAPLGSYSKVLQTK
jgi:hypothetical protein